MKKRIVSVVLALVLCVSCFAQVVLAKGVDSTVNRPDIAENEKNTTVGLFRYFHSDEAVDILLNGPLHSYVLVGDKDDATSLPNFVTSLLFADLGNEYVSKALTHRTLYLTDESLARAEANDDFWAGDFGQKTQTGTLQLSDDPGTLSFFLPVPTLERPGLNEAVNYWQEADAFYEKLAKAYLQRALDQNLETLKTRGFTNYSVLSWAYNTRAGQIITVHPNEETGENVRENTRSYQNLVYCLGESDTASRGEKHTSYYYRTLLTEYYEKFLGYPHENHVWMFHPASAGTPSYEFCLSCGAVKK